MNSKFSKASIRTLDSSIEIHDRGNILKFYHVWLRDHCKCSQCYNEKTHQKSTNVLDIPLDIKPLKCEIVADCLKIAWNDGHKTECSVDWLESLSFPLKTKREVTFWDKNDVINFYDTKVHIQEYLMNNDGVKRVLASLLKYGFAYVTGVEPTVEATKEVVQRIAPPQKTLFGEMWMVGDNYDHDDTAYTKIPLGAHNDNTYFSEAAGLQVFHMLSHEGTGGETLLVDGFNIANNLKIKNPEAFEILCNDPIESQYIEEGYYFSHIEPIIKLHPVTKQLVQIRYNVYDRATLNTLPHNKVLKYYGAYQAFGREICESTYVLKEKLMPGSVLLFDNWRVLHGRSAYTGKRELAGCYVSRAEWLSKARALGLHIF